MVKDDKFINFVKKFLVNFFAITFFLSLFSTSNAVAMDYSDKKVIPIAMATDDGYVRPTLVAMNSIMETKNEDVFIKFYVMVPGNMSWENKERFKNFKNLYKNGCTVDIVDMKDKFSQVERGVYYITYPTCYRLLISSYLPQYDKVLYIDGDTLIRHDLWDLYSTNIDSFYIAGVRETVLWSSKSKKEHARKMGIKNMDNYVNAGVLLFNTKKIRETEGLENKFLEYIPSLKRRGLPYLDQDVLNAVCYEKIKRISPVYNSMVNFFNRGMFWAFSDCCKREKWHEVFDDPVIVHYAGGSKPWNISKVKFCKEWEKRGKKIEDNFYKTIENGIYTIESALSHNMVLDISNSSRDNETNLQLWDSNGTNAQKFHVLYVGGGLYELAPMCSGKRVDVDHSGKSNGTNIWQWEANGTDAQKWYIKPVGNGYYNIISKCNGLCLDVHGSQTEKGTNIWCYGKNGTNAQKFRFRAA